MKTFRSKGPFPERPYYTDQEIEMMCVEELRQVSLLPDEPGPVRIDRFIEKRFGRPHEYESLEDGILGLTRFGAKGVQTIVVSLDLENENTTVSGRRLRTTLAHEVGHGLLHSHLFVLGMQKPLFGDWKDQQRPKVLCRDVHHAGYRGDWWEHQANMVMGTILLPANLAMKAIESLLTPSGSLGAMELSSEGRRAAARLLSETFDVNPVVAEIRLQKLVPVEKSGQLRL